MFRSISIIFLRQLTNDDFKSIWVIWSVIMEHLSNDLFFFCCQLFFLPSPGLLGPLRALIQYKIYLKRYICDWCRIFPLQSFFSPSLKIPWKFFEQWKFQIKCNSCENIFSIFCWIDVSIFRIADCTSFYFFWQMCCLPLIQLLEYFRDKKKQFNWNWMWRKVKKSFVVVVKIQLKSFPPLFFHPHGSNIDLQNMWKYFVWWIVNKARRRKLAETRKCGKRLNPCQTITKQNSHLKWWCWAFCGAVWYVFETLFSSCSIYWRWCKQRMLCE